MTQSNKIKFVVPSFMYGTLPESGVVTKDYLLTGSDNVTVTVKQSTDTYYDDKTRTFESNQTGNVIFYVFKFPKDTQIQENKTFTTPNKSVYTFSHATDNSNINYQFEKLVSQGTITIVPPPVTNTLSSSETRTPLPSSVNQDSIPNTPIADNSMSDFLKDSPFEYIGLLIYKLFSDMVPVFIFWFLMISISCWLVVKPNDLYPSDVSKYPYIFYEANSSGDVKEAHDIRTFDQANSKLCTLISPGEAKDKLSAQNKYFDELDKDKDSDILNIINPSFLNPSATKVLFMSKTLIDLCGKDDACSTDVFRFFLGKIMLNNYVQCNMVLSMIHMGASMIQQRILSNIPSKLSVIFFACVLYFLYLSVSSVNDMVIEKFAIKMSSDNNMKTLLLNQFYLILISILSCCFCLILPLSTILVITCLMSTIYTTGRMVFSAITPGIFFLSFFTILFSLSQYTVIIMNLASGMNPLQLLESLYVKEFSFITFLSIIGVTLPILMGLVYSVYLSLKMFITFFQFFKIPSVAERMKGSSAAIVLVALFLLLMNVKEMLGDSYVVMTLTLILLIGFYVLTKTG